MNNTLTLLLQAPLFAGLTAKQLEALWHQAKLSLHTVPASASIFSQEQNGTAALLLSGAVTELRIGPSAMPLSETHHEKGALLGYARLFASTNDLPPTQFIAQTDCRLLLLDRAQLQNLFALDARLCFNCLALLSQADCTQQEDLRLLSLNSIQARVSYFLLRSYEKTGSRYIQLDYSKKQWAKNLRVPRTSLSRELRRLRELGILSFYGRTVKIDRLEELRRCLEYCLLQSSQQDSGISRQGSPAS